MPNNTSFLLFYYIIGFCFILFLAYYVTKFIAKRTNSVISEKNVRIIQNIRLDKNNRITIVIIYSKLYVLGISNNNISVLDKFDIKAKESSDTEKTEYNNFEQYLNSYIYAKPNYELNKSDNIKNKIKCLKIKLIKLLKKGDFTSDKEDEYEKKN